MCYEFQNNIRKFYFLSKNAPDFTKMKLQFEQQKRSKIRIDTPPNNSF